MFRQAQHDDMENFKYSLSFRAQAKNLVETKHYYIYVILHHSAPARLPRRTSRLAMTKFLSCAYNEQFEKTERNTEMKSKETPHRSKTQRTNST